MSIEQLIYTDAPRGAGLDPSASGYQVKAASPGLDAAARELLAAIAMHYGDAVYRAAPRAALEKENAWRSQTSSLDRVAPEVLNDFPIIWSYDRLADDLYALTRIAYIGLTHDERFGNFLAHALVFAPEALASYRHNPLTLAFAGLPGNAASAVGTALPVLNDLGPGVSGEADLKLLSSAPYRESLASLAAALAGAVAGGKPVLLALTESRMALPLGEALLQLLPPSARGRLTFCTHESERAWTPSTRQGTKGVGHQLIVLAGERDRLNLRSDEVQSTYAAFNWATQQFSPPIQRPYALAAKDLGVLHELHALIERLGAGRDSAAWDEIAPASALFDARADTGALVAAALALATAASEPKKADISLEVITRVQRVLAERDDAAGLTSLAAALTPLLSHANVNADQGYFAQLQSLVGQALKQGRAR